MSNSSQQLDSLVISDNTITVVADDNLSTYCPTYSSCDTITISGHNTCSISYPMSAGSFSTLSTTQISALTTSQIGTITLGNIDTSMFTINLPEEWVNCFPDFDRIESMCKEYPGLKIAYDKFRTIYSLVRDDYDTPKDKRLKP